MKRRLRGTWLRRAALALAGIALLSAAGCAVFRGGRPGPLPANAVRSVIAVTSFENRSGFSGQWQLGSGMADLLVSELVECDHFTVVERTQLEQVVHEIDTQRDPHYRDEGRVDYGRLKNARYLIRGVINDFDQVGGGSLGFAVSRFLLLGFAYKARVSLTLTIIDVESGEILAAVQTEGFARAREAYAEGSYKGMKFGGDVFFRTPLGTATQRAIRQGVNRVCAKVPRQPWRLMIADVLTDRRFVLNAGADRHLDSSVVYQVRGRGRPVTDPVTGNIISVIPGPLVGTVRVVEVGESISYAAPVDGQGFSRGQLLTPIGTVGMPVGGR